MPQYFRSFPIARGVTFIEDITHTFCYLVEGNEYAALIDTGTGIGNLADYVRTCTDKPVRVLITHVHPDHFGGVYSFSDTPVYVPKGDIPAINGRDTSLEARRNFLISSNGGVCPCPEEDLLPCREIEVQEVRDGNIFDLGGRSLLAIEVPGHTHGSTVYLDRANRMIFLGDAANQNTLLSCETSEPVETYYESLLRLKQFESEYDNFFICHGAPIAAKQTLDDLIELCEEVMQETKKGNQIGEITPNFNPYGDARRVRPTDSQTNRLDGGHGNLVYRPCRVWKGDFR